VNCQNSISRIVIAPKHSTQLERVELGAKLIHLSGDLCGEVFSLLVGKLNQRPDIVCPRDESIELADPRLFEGNALLDFASTRGVVPEAGIKPQFLELGDGVFSGSDVKDSLRARLRAPKGH
jgi:hypothetical protein